MSTEALQALLNSIAQNRLPLLVVRHGQTAWNAERRFLGKSDVPLDPTGQAQSARLGAYLAGLPVRTVITSPLGRASETAAAICAPRGTTADVADDLIEMDQGTLEGRPWRVLPEEHPELLQAWIHDPTDVPMPGGESFGACRDRALGFVRRLEVDYSPAGPPLVLVTHKMVIAALICTALDLPLRMHHRIGQQNTALNVLSLGDGRLEVHRLNATAHLATSPPR
jgi:broad specificity phosphatase PhoE